MIGFFRFVLVLLLLVAVAMTSAIVTMHFAIHGTEVSIPQFKGMTVPDAGRRGAGMGLRITVENRLYSAEVPAGRVANQAPAAGTIVRRGWRVWLTESLGPQKLAIPDLLGVDQRLATIEIRRVGLQTGTVAEMPWPDAQPGTVIAQSPEANASGVARPAVNLLVASAPPPQAAASFVMPDLRGQIFSAAALTLVRAGLHLAPVAEQSVPVSSPGSPAQPAPAPGTVIAQAPPPGSRIDPATPLQLTVAK